MLTLLSLEDLLIGGKDRKETIKIEMFVSMAFWPCHMYFSVNNTLVIDINVCHDKEKMMTLIWS